MFSLSFSSSLHLCVLICRWPCGGRRVRTLLPSDRGTGAGVGVATWGISSTLNDDPAPIDYDPSGDILGLEVDLQPRKVISSAAKLRSWFGPNGQYIRELPCPSCRGRGYTPCTECGIERSRSDCSECNGKGLKTCRKCMGDCVIWEESIDERPWEKAQSSSPLKVKEDDEVDNLEIKVDVARKTKRVYQSPSPEVGLKISRSLRSLNAKTGLFTKRMKIIHRDPMLHAQRVAAIKRAKSTDAARKQASETMKAFFLDPENRLKRSVAMKGVKFYCSHCGEEGHRRYYCSKLRNSSGKRRFQCRLCGGKGHNRRTCERSRSSEVPKESCESSHRQCSVCHQIGHNRRTCATLTQLKDESSYLKKVSSCSMCHQIGHNRRTCPQLTQLKDKGSDWKKVSMRISNRKRNYSCSLCREKGHNMRTCSVRNGIDHSTIQVKE